MKNMTIVFIFKFIVWDAKRDGDKLIRKSAVKEPFARFSL
jgi:hypothetical protein